MNNISKYFDKSSKKRGLVKIQNQKRKGKMLEKEVQKLTIQMIPLKLKFFSKLIAQLISQKY